MHFGCLPARPIRSLSVLAVTPLNSAHPSLQPLRDIGMREETLAQALAFYDEPHRRYHNRVHLREMFEYAAMHALALSPAQTLAVLFHDAIYVPGAARGSNEALSAQLLRVYCNRLPAAVVDGAVAIILDTADHLARGEDAQLVLDLDLLRLAVAPADFERYSREVFDEQRPLIMIDDDDAAWHFFLGRRIAFFERLLQRQSIFHRPTLRARHEAAARSNLERAVRQMRAAG
jgi:predicted metal-dependent HD superfamily phosphohydrolase